MCNEKLCKIALTSAIILTAVTCKNTGWNAGDWAPIPLIGNLEPEPGSAKQTNYVNGIAPASKANVGI